MASLSGELNHVGDAVMGGKFRGHGMMGWSAPDHVAGRPRERDDGTDDLQGEGDGAAEGAGGAGRLEETRERRSRGEEAGAR